MKQFPKNFIPNRISQLNGVMEINTSASIAASFAAFVAASFASTASFCAFSIVCFKGKKAPKSYSPRGLKIVELYLFRGS